MSKIRGSCLDCSESTYGRNALRCKKCNNLSKKNPDYRKYWAIKKKYNLEPMEVEALWLSCYGKCFICRKNMKWPEKKRGQTLDVVAIDHDHKTGKVRGLLCNACNKALGLFKDNVDLLKSAIKYINGE